MKRALGRAAAECLHPDKTHKLIKEEAKKALENLSNAKVYKINSPIKFEVEFFLTHMADQASLYPFAERIDGKTVKVQGETFLEGYRAFMNLLELARIYIYLLICSIAMINFNTDSLFGSCVFRISSLLISVP